MLRLLCAFVTAAFFFGIVAIAAVSGIKFGGDWGDLPGYALFAAVLWGPFLLYVLGVRTQIGTVAIGAILVGVAGYAFIRATTGEHSTSGLQILWLPLIGYPLVLVAALIDRWSR
jgi:hypothetical protein